MNCAKNCKGLYVPNIPNYIHHAAYKCYVFVKSEELKDEWNRDKILNEINLLDEIYDIKHEEYNRLRDDFWKNT